MEWLTGNCIHNFIIPSDVNGTNNSSMLHDVSMLRQINCNALRSNINILGSRQVGEKSRKNKQNQSSSLKCLLTSTSWCWGSLAPHLIGIYMNIYIIPGDFFFSLPPIMSQGPPFPFSSRGPPLTMTTATVKLRTAIILGLLFILLLRLSERHFSAAKRRNFLLSITHYHPYIWLILGQI